MVVLELKRNSKMDNLTHDFMKRGISESDLKRLARLSKGDEHKFRRYAQRRLFHEPLAYIEGEAVFYGRRFKVDRRVYVPNPETEQLVKIVLDDIDDDSIVLDVGTGSGCIGITIKKEKPSVNVYGSDIDPNTLSVAKQNAQLHGVQIPYFESYYADNVPIHPTHVVADMPYGNGNYTLRSIDIREFQHMPPQACFHPLGIMEAYKELIESIQRKKWNCKLFFESGVVGREEVKKIIPKNLHWEYMQYGNYSVTRVDINF